MSPARVEVLRETVKIAKFELPPDALPETTESKAVSRAVAPAAVPVPDWERKVAAALWVIAAGIVATLWFAQT